MTMRIRHLLVWACALVHTACIEVAATGVDSPHIVGYALLTFDDIGEPHMSATIRTAATLEDSFATDGESAGAVGVLDLTAATQQRTRYIFASFDVSALMGAPAETARRAVVSIGAEGRTLGGSAITTISDGNGNMLDSMFAMDVRPAAMPAFNADGKIVFQGGSLRSATGAEIAALRRQSGVHIFAPAFIADGRASFAFALPLLTNARANVQTMSILLLFFEYT